MVDSGTESKPLERIFHGVVVIVDMLVSDLVPWLDYGAFAGQNLSENWTLDLPV